MNSEKTILIAEDDYAIALALKTIVTKNCECNLIMASDGEEAWQAMQNNDVDLVISDWNMPVKTGVELLREMRADKRFADMPFLMLTSRSDKDSVVDAIEAGVSAYMHKPFDRHRLMEKIRQMVVGEWDLPEDNGLQAG